MIIDCRYDAMDKESGRKAYQNGHIPNAVFANLDEDLSGKIIKGKTGRHPLPSIKIIIKRLRKWGVHNKSQVVVYDDKGGAIASRLWWMLQWLGHEKVAVLNGGIQAWGAKKHPLSKEIPSPKKGNFEAQPNKKMLVDANVIFDDLGKRKYLLVDSRAAVRFRGESEPLDPIAGHIPTAISAPFMENVDAQKEFLSKKKLKKRFKKIVGNKKTKKVVFYCGSGITACHNLLALKHAGLGEAKLYPGSWSDWITDEKRPIVTKEKKKRK